MTPSWCVGVSERSHGRAHCSLFLSFSLSLFKLYDGIRVVGSLVDFFSSLHQLGQHTHSYELDDLLSLHGILERMLGVFWWECSSSVLVINMCFSLLCQCCLSLVLPIWLDSNGVREKKKDTDQAYDGNECNIYLLHFLFGRNVIAKTIHWLIWLFLFLFCCCYCWFHHLSARPHNDHNTTKNEW